MPLCRRGGRPTVLLLRQKKVGEEKASRSQGGYWELLGSDANFAAVRSTAPCGRACGSANLDSDPTNPCSRQAGSSSNLLRCTALKQSLALIRLPRRCSALPHGGGRWNRIRIRERVRDRAFFEVRARIRHAFGAPCGFCAAKSRTDTQNPAARRFF